MQKINEIGLQDLNNIKIIDPLSYLDFISLIKSSQFVLTDSGGIQEETTYLGIPCLTLRYNTEGPITLTHGTNTLVSQENLFHVINKREFMNKKAKKIPMWDGLTAHRISDVIVRFLEAL
jgi:UDP-N-acetylglucosamine 2-epimerase (non-hydrolysing)